MVELGFCKKMVIFERTFEHTHHSPRARVDEKVEVGWRKIILNYCGAVIVVLRLVLLLGSLWL